MPRRIPQPPVRPFARRRETRTAWPGLSIALIALVLLWWGEGRLTIVEKLQGDAAVEREVNMALAHGGVQVTAAVPAARPPPGLELPPWIPQPGLTPPRSGAELRPGGQYRLRIDATAKDPCPT